MSTTFGCVFFPPWMGIHLDARRMVIGLLARGRVHGPLHRHRPVIGRCLSRVGGLGPGVNLRLFSFKTP